MKKLYNYLLPVLLCLVAVSCDSDDEEVIRLTHQDPVVTVESISPMVGYRGNEFTVKGTNFGIVASDVEVFMGTTKLELVECQDEELKVRIPEGATAGRISVVVYGQRVDTQLMYDVLGAPGITKIEPSYGFVGTPIIFTGHDLGVSSAFYSVLFAGLTETTYLSSEPTNESFSVNVPEGAQSGEITLAITGNPVNVPVPFTVLQHATLDAINGEAAGYATGLVSISGTNLNQTVLDESVVLDPVKAFFTPKAGGDAVEAEVKSQEDKLLSIQIPASLVPGDYTISVATPFEKIEKTFDFKILQNPVLTSIEPLRGYVGATVTVVAENLGIIAKEDIQMKFGETLVTDITLVDEKTFTVKVPSLTTFGETSMSMTIHGIDMNMGQFAKFEILASPVITSVETDNGFDSKAVQVGNTITIRGTGFQNSTISSAMFRGEELNYTVLSDTEITASVSDKFTAGEDVVTLKFNDVVVDVVSSDKLNMLTVGADITHYVLKNSVQPFQVSSSDRNCGAPVDWMVDPSALNYKFNDGNGIIQNVNANGLLSVQSGWDFNPMTDGKVYQKTKLPTGNYKFKLDVAECGQGSSKGRFCVYFVVTSGNEIPNIVVNEWILDDVTGVLGSYKITDNPSVHSYELDITSQDSNADLTVGLVAQMASQGWCKLSGIRVYLAE